MKKCLRKFFRLFSIIKNRRRKKLETTVPIESKWEVVTPQKTYDDYMNIIKEAIFKYGGSDFTKGCKHYLEVNKFLTQKQILRLQKGPIRYTCYPHQYSRSRRKKRRYSKCYDYGCDGEGDSWVFEGTGWR